MTGRTGRRFLAVVILSALVLAGVMVAGTGTAAARGGMKCDIIPPSDSVTALALSASWPKAKRDQASLQMVFYVDGVEEYSWNWAEDATTTEDGVAFNVTGTGATNHVWRLTARLLSGASPPKVLASCDYSETIPFVYPY